MVSPVVVIHYQQPKWTVDYAYIEAAAVVSAERGVPVVADFGVSLYGRFLYGYRLVITPRTVALSRLV